MYNKKDIDVIAEREGTALRRQGRYKQSRYVYIGKQTSEHNAEEFNKLFKRSNA